MKKTSKRSQTVDTIPEDTTNDLSELLLPARRLTTNRLKILQLIDLAERCVKLGLLLETRDRFSFDTEPHLEELRAIIASLLESLMLFDDPNAKAAVDQLRNLIEWWSAQPRNVAAGHC